jgi:hypothetical protein
MQSSRFVLLCLGALAVLGRGVADAETERELGFNEHILPLLTDYCFACHGPDSASRKADLRLDTREGALSSGAFVLGKANESELIARISSVDPDEVMPPPAFGRSVTPEHREVLKRWIDDGARYEKHWSFLSPVKSPLPEPRNASWARGAVDRFVLARLEGLQLEPNGPADPYTLARRVALDLTGLPPSKPLLEAYVSDTSEVGYRRYVDALLASTRAAEHRARYWLDAARYGDTHGMHVDNYREIWPYRDWVIRAFHANKPFDEFVTEQIAGDLLPEGALEQRVATGFNRCNITTSEGGAIPEELDVRYMVDRVETTATVFLGLTAGCAVCHDHKYDPISQREFYQFGAFFNNTTQPAMDGNQRDTPPAVALPDGELKEEWDQLQARRRGLRRQEHEGEEGAKKWWASRPTSVEHPIATDALLLWRSLTKGDDDELVEVPSGVSFAMDHPEGTRGVRFEAGAVLTDELPELRTDEPLTLSFWVRTPDQVLSLTMLDQTTKSADDKTVGFKVRTGGQGGLTFELQDGKGAAIRGNLPDNSPLRPRAWQHVCVRYSGGQASSSVMIFADGQSVPLRTSTDRYIDAATVPGTTLKIGSDAPTAGLSDIRVLRRAVSDGEVKLLAGEYRLKALLAGDVAALGDLSVEDRALAVAYYREIVDPESSSRARKLAATTTRRDYIYARSTTTLVMQERPTEPRAWILERGEYDQKREKVSPGVPAVLPALPDGAPRNRLGLARWLVDPEHPLTARVAVNQLWQSIFGVGLVKTSEDFGVMGERPSHPQLLDWLAVEFVESGWDVRHILRQIVTSAAYRQSSVVVPEKLRADPDNRLLSRAPRLRLEAEVLRDQSLDVSGLLEKRVGGPSVRPYQPGGLWKVVAIQGSNTGEFKKDSGDALYRRSLYTFWKRTSPPPAMAAFNAPTREQCTVRRERTNTPLQALVLMNDTQFVEAARNLAQRAMTAHSDPQARASWMFSTVLSRPADETDLTDVQSAADEYRRLLQEDLDGAKELIQTGDSEPDATLDALELATWTMVANTLMNRDDFINKE